MSIIKTVFTISALRFIPESPDLYCFFTIGHINLYENNHKTTVPTTSFYEGLGTGPNLVKKRKNYENFNYSCKNCSNQSMERHRKDHRSGYRINISANIRLRHPFMPLSNAPVRRKTVARPQPRYLLAHSRSNVGCFGVCDTAILYQH